MKIFKVGKKRISFIFLLIIFGFFNHYLNLSSNLFLLFPPEGEVMVNEKGWRKLTPGNTGFITKTEFQSHAFTVKEMSFRRNHPSFFQRQISKIFPGKIKIIEISPENEFMIVADPHSGFRSMNTGEALRSSQANFVLNANFYGTNNQIVGELILAGKKFKNQTNDSGFFRVIKNTPYVGPRSYINTIPGDIQYSCQAFPSVMNKGQIFPYIISEKRPSKLQWKKKTYRNLVGRKENGNIVFILSNQRGFLSIKEITTIAKVYGVDTAALFDGGKALQYRINHPDFKMSFAAFNNSFSLGRRIDNIFMKRHRSPFIQKSPVFIGVKLL
jgi:uncharacterized protein YigE (DUF2233 family)